jgi:uncharacterized membrane protein
VDKTRRRTTSDDRPRTLSEVWRVLGQERGLVALVGMAIAGIAVAAYLTAVHYTPLPLVCSTTGVINCAQVTSSRYSVVPGTTVPITIPGILWFLVSGGLAGVGLVRVWQRRVEPARLRLAQLVWAALGLGFVLYLVYIEIVLLHRLCEWCTVVHLLILVTFLVALNRAQRQPEVSSAPLLRQQNRSPNTRQGTGNGSRAAAHARYARRVRK